MTYSEFLKSKEITSCSSGFEVDKAMLNKSAFEWQRDIVAWALKKGKAALFEDCGLGKTLQQLMFADAVSKKTGAPVMIFAPLAVTHQTKNEGIKFGYNVKICREMEDVEPGINIANYEISEKFNMRGFGGVVLDESSILKDFTGNTCKQMIDMCAVVPYRLCCTATPSPNDYAELGNHAEFLGVMSRTEMLATFFVHDGGDTSKWRLKGHAVDKFFAWVASWACCMTSPADLGYDGKQYQLPPLNITEHVVNAGSLIDDMGQTMLFAKTSQTLSERRNARKSSLEQRVKCAAEIANKLSGQCLIWCDLNDESTALTESICGAQEVKGADKPEDKINRMNGFTDGTVKCLVSKPKIAGWGMNWQNCNEVIFVGLSDSFEAYYQAVRRCWRFGQKLPVNIHIVISDAEGAVKSNIERKQKDAENMKQQLIKYTKSILSADIKSTKRMTEKYCAGINMQIPSWLKGNAV